MKLYKTFSNEFLVHAHIETNKRNQNSAVFSFKFTKIKKLVYVYLMRYAEEQQDLALLSISTFQRALKVRIVCNISNLFLFDIEQIISLPLDDFLFV